MSVAIAVGLLTAAAVYLFMQRGMVRIVLGFVLASHAANLMLFAAGNTAFREVPYIGIEGEQADPLPQAFVLTAIVIAFSITMFMVTLAITTTTDDDTENEEASPAKVLTGDVTDVSVHGIDTASGEIAVESQQDETGDNGSAQAGKEESK